MEFCGVFYLHIRVIVEISKCKSVGRGASFPRFVPCAQAAFPVVLDAGVFSLGRNRPHVQKLLFRGYIFSEMRGVFISKESMAAGS